MNIFKINEESDRTAFTITCRYRTQISDVLTGFGCIPGRWSGVPDAICMRAGPRDEKYVEISHSPPGWHVMCNKTEFMFPQNLNTFLPGTVPRGSGLGRNLNKKRSATLAVNTAAALGNTESASFDVIVLPCAELWTCHPDHGGQHRPAVLGGHHGRICHKAAANVSIVPELFLLFSLLTLPLLWPIWELLLLRRASNETRPWPQPQLAPT